MYKNKLAYTLTHQHPGEQFEQCKDCEDCEVREDTFTWAAHSDKHILGAHGAGQILCNV